MARAGTWLVVVGLVAATFGALWQLGLVPGSRLAVPRPVALAAGQRDTQGSSGAPTTPVTPTAPPLRAVVAPTPTSVATAVLAAALPPTPAPVLVPTPRPSPLVPADAVDRNHAPYFETGYAVRLAIPAIQLDTAVKQGSIVPDANGNPSWQTLPFVAVHYGELTSLIGAFGNAVIAGHVVTIREGNVFRFLYKVQPGDEVQVWDDQQREHDFQVVDLKLVPPSDTSVMAKTPDETLTLITCGGTFDPIKREFSDRLVVIAKPLVLELSPPS